MKKKKTKDIFDTQCWQWQIITDPYQVVAEFFVLCDIANFRREITKIMRYTQRAKIPKDPDPTTLLLDMNALKSLIKAAYVLKNNKSISLKIDDKHLCSIKIFIAIPLMSFRHGTISRVSYRKQNSVILIQY
ncbi:hypothetical protein A9P82_09670 [Arachidicoccus ginsenosidimutans]|uniref:hypothetical protein n=1 Tax=Arachidicoccus sp. BS20 TaxID=1850526 RepID=UPI0007F16EBE|nr:hypothetical protein [Arachidicoccus sp. BS20]ANI89535.1 hypothetical protein A9P82_09670 [Arachidicoccus sp. BS20]